MLNGTVLRPHPHEARDDPHIMNTNRLYFRAFVLLLAATTLAFAGLLQPYFSALFWGAILAILFMPLHKRVLSRMPARRNLAALLTLTTCLLIVIVPMGLITGSLVQEGVHLARRVATGEWDVAHGMTQLIDALPPIARQWLTDFGIVDLDSLRQKVSTGLIQGSQFLATQALNAGQNTFEFLVSLGIMLYLLFFLLRDGAQLARQCQQRIPLSAAHQRQLFGKFATVVRATVKGNLVIAVLQGALGGLIFWILGIQGALLWGVLMMFLSLLPAVGAALIWFPAAAVFLVTGATGSGITLLLYGVLVIGLVDNVLRPILVGKDTKLPDYLVLISTLGGLSLFGLTGFVIGPLIAALFITCWDMLASFMPDQAESKHSPPAPTPTTQTAVPRDPPRTPPRNPRATPARSSSS